MEKIVFLNETKKTAGVRNEICKEYTSEEGSASDGTNHFYRAKKKESGGRLVVLVAEQNQPQ